MVGVKGFQIVRGGEGRGEDVRVNFFIFCFY